MLSNFTFLRHQIIHNVSIELILLYAPVNLGEDVFDRIVGASMFSICNILSYKYYCHTFISSKLPLNQNQH